MENKLIAINRLVDVAIDFYKIEDDETALALLKIAAVGLISIDKKCVAKGVKNGNTKEN